MKILVVSSAKGGVGKTTVALNLAYTMARRGRRTLLLDTDPQGGIGYSLSQKCAVRPGFLEFCMKGQALSEVILQTNEELLHLMPAGQSAWQELEPYERGLSTGHFLEKLRMEADANYDLCVVDTATGLNTPSLGVLAGADYVLSPLQAEPLASRTIPRMLACLSTLQQRRPSLLFLGFLLTLWRSGDGLSTSIVQQIRARFPESFLLYSMLPYDPVFLEASAAGLPLGLLHSPPPAAAVLFEQLGVELETRMRSHMQEFSDEPRSLVD